MTGASGEAASPRQRAKTLHEGVVVAVGVVENDDDDGYDDGYVSHGRFWFYSLTPVSSLMR